jgi:hypothetical protein
LWVAIGFPALLILLEASPIAPDFFFVLIGIPALYLAWVGLGIWSAVLTVKWLRQRIWRHAVINAVLPLVILGAGLNFIGFIRFCNNAGDTIHFYVRQDSYMKMVRATPQNGEPRLLIINLGGMSWASRGFVYDESDEVMWESVRQSPDWKARAQKSELGCGYGAVPVPGPSTLSKHWYIASFAC